MCDYPTLTDREWQAVSTALSDAGRQGCAAARPAGRFWRVLRGILGSRRSPAPADPRLEAIRSFVCEARRSRRVPEQQVPQLIAEGFNRDQAIALAMLAA